MADFPKQDICHLALFIEWKEKHEQEIAMPCCARLCDPAGRLSDPKSTV
jgi:hypothetical protein